MKIITICPSVNNRNMVTKSFFDTITEDNSLFFCSDGTVTEALNSFIDDIPKYDFVHITNDDVEYKTKGWDTQFVNLAKQMGHGIYYGNDLIQGENLPTFPFVSREIIQAIGWLQLPTLEQYCGDVVWKYLGKQCNFLYYLPSIIIEHKWKADGSEDIHMKDMKSFAEWLPHSHITISKIKAILNSKERI